MSGRRDLKSALGEVLLQKIKDRTADGVGRNGRAFKGYSDAYKESDEFKAAGKSETGPANLNLTGDMLGLIKIKNPSGNTITIEWDDKEESAKAHGHITGNKEGPGVRRDFFGLRARDIAEVKREIRDELKDIKNNRGRLRSEAIQRLIDAVDEGFDDGTDS